MLIDHKFVRLGDSTPYFPVPVPLMRFLSFFLKYASLFRRCEPENNAFCSPRYAKCSTLSGSTQIWRPSSCPSFFSLAFVCPKWHLSRVSRRVVDLLVVTNVTKRRRSAKVDIVAFRRIIHHYLTARGISRRNLSICSLDVCSGSQ